MKSQGCSSIGTQSDGPSKAMPAPGGIVRWVPGFVTAIYLACVLLVNPAGEFPLNDDWCYTRSAFGFAAENRMQVDEFSAPSLVGQALYGGLLAKCLGKSFLLLRLSTIVLSLCTALLLRFVFLRLDVPENIAWVALLAWIFNPIQFCLAFSFMTEIPFLFFITLSIAFLVLFLQSDKSGYLAASGAAVGYAFLIRQTAVLFLGAAALALLAETGNGGHLSKLKRLVCLLGPSSIIMAAYLLWTGTHGGATAASTRKFELLRHLTREQVLGNFFGLLFYLAFMLMPLWLYLVPQAVRIWHRHKIPATFVLVFWSALSCFGLWWFQSHYSRFPYLPARAFHAQMPFLLNVLFDSGLGPITLDPTYYGPPPIPVYPKLWLGITFLTAFGLVVMGLLGTSRTDSAESITGDRNHRPVRRFALISLLAAGTFEVVSSHVQEGGLFDRHLLIAALPLAVYMGLISARRASCDTRRFALSASAIAAIALAALAWFSITATHDYLAWNRCRWDLGNELLACSVDPLTISGGFEFNAWHNYDTFRARGKIEKVFYWWYDNPIYVIAMEPQEGYGILKRTEYLSWLHLRRLPVYLLSRK